MSIFVYTYILYTCICDIVCISDSESHSDIQPHWVSALMWPRYNTVQETDQVTMDSLLIGRLDGSVGIIDVTDSYVFNRCELEHCSRENGMIYTYYYAVIVIMNPRYKYRTMDIIYHL